MFTKGQTILRELGDGLVLRRSTPEDAEHWLRSIA